MSFVIRIFGLFLIIIQLVACGGSDPTSAPISGPGGGGTGSGASSTNSPLEISVRTNYSLSSVKTEVVNCSLPSNTLPSTPAANGTCTVQIPELDLYYSDLEFRVSTNSAATCAQIVFTPFQYRRSNSATFVNDADGTTIDCTAVPPDLYCFGGAAKFIQQLDSYPTNTAIYFLTANELSKSYTMLSADVNRSTDRHASMSENINVANNFTGNRATSVLDGAGGIVDYVANSFVDYRFDCNDRWGETLYSWTLTIGDDDLLDVTSNTTFDRFYDWGN